MSGPVDFGIERGADAIKKQGGGFSDFPIRKALAYKSFFLPRAAHPKKILLTSLCRNKVTVTHKRVTLSKFIRLSNIFGAIAADRIFAYGGMLNFTPPNALKRVVLRRRTQRQNERSDFPKEARKRRVRYKQSKFIPTVLTGADNSFII